MSGGGPLLGYVFSLDVCESINLWKNMIMKRPFAATVVRGGKWYVSQCREIDVAGLEVGAA